MYYSGYQVKKDEIGGSYARMVERINTYRVLVRKRGRKRLLVRHRRRWNDSIKTFSRSMVGWPGVGSCGSV